ncbi:MAG TPA: ABC transporter transmembrane domain-containing protein, partial [Tepidisphaeraceae bacterium]
MFRFLSPVKPLTFMACTWLALWVGAEVMANRQAGETINQINTINASNIVGEQGFWRWLASGHPEAVQLRHFTFVLAALVVLYGLLRYLKEVSNIQMSMTLVYYIREAVYDKLQRVGFGFHDRMSSGQLINRALTDLNQVRMFVMAVTTMLEIALVVSFYVVLIYTRNHWLAVLALIPLPLWTWYILKFSRTVQPAAKSVMEAEDRNVSLITENIAGVHVIKAFATEPQEMAKYSANCDMFMGRVLKRIRLFANFNPVIRTIAMASNLSLFLLLGILIVRSKGQPGALSAGEFLALGA